MFQLCHVLKEGIMAKDIYRKIIDLILKASELARSIGINIQHSIVSIMLCTKGRNNG